RAEKQQVQDMVMRLLNLPEPPEPADAADALAIAICHIHTASTLKRYKRTKPRKSLHEEALCHCLVHGAGRRGTKFADCGFVDCGFANSRPAVSSSRSHCY